VLSFYTNHQHIPFSKYELCDDASVVSVPQLMKEIDIVVPKTTTCAENNNFDPITSAHDEIKLLSYLNTLDYIEFDVLCNLNNLEVKLSFITNVPWLSKHTYHFIGRYNWKVECMVYQVYICSNMNSPFVMKEYDHLEGCVKDNHITSNSTCPSCMFCNNRVNFKNGSKVGRCQDLPQYFRQTLTTLSREQLKTKKG
jgi:hypothetical protein